MLTPLPSQMAAAKATDQPDTDAKPAEPDPAEIWKKDFQCQWYKTADGDVSDQQSPKDGASVGGPEGENTGDEVGVTTTSVTTTLTTKSASVTELRESNTLPGTGSPLELPTNSGNNPLSAPNLTVLLLLVAGSLCLKP